jgi:AAHS family 4-hydroxybenzoate transporter-like MFS transporter
MFYPTSIRATGFGWALGVGRAGSIAGPVLGGIMLSEQWQTSSVFLAAAIAPLLACLAVFVIGRLG